MEPTQEPQESLPEQPTPSQHLGSHPIPLGKARLTFSATAYHQQVGEDAKPLTIRHSRILEGDEQPYGPRRLKADENWRTLDCGWVETAGLLILENREGLNGQQRPTEEEKRAVEGKVVELAIVPPGTDEAVPFAILLPYGGFTVLHPITIRNLRIRCRKGEARCFLSLIPE